jgi:hypothetical protein
MPGIAKASHDKKSCTIDYSVERRENSSRKGAKAQRQAVTEKEDVFPLRLCAFAGDYFRGT